MYLKLDMQMRVYLVKNVLFCTFFQYRSFQVQSSCFILLIYYSICFCFYSFTERILDSRYYRSIDQEMLSTTIKKCNFGLVFRNEMLCKSDHERCMSKHLKSYDKWLINTVYFIYKHHLMTILKLQL